MNKIDRNHNEKRKILRIVGPIVLITGLIFIIVGMVDFFSSTRIPFGGGPNLFWCNFVGMPLIFVGFVLTSAGYMGAVARYQAEEIAPVGKDVFNYMAEGTSKGVETIAKSIHNGITGNDTKTLVCIKCNEENDTDAKFCKSCGDVLNKKVICNNCGKENEVDSKFCNSCGIKIL